MSRKVLFVASHRPGRAPNQRFRFEQYIPYLEGQGYEIEHSYLIDENLDRILYSKGNYGSKLRFILDSYKKRKRDLKKVEDHDLVFVAREALMFASTFFEKGVARSKAKMILDIDDAVWLPNVSGSNARFGWVKGPRKIHNSMRYADLIIAGNSYLATYAQHFNPKVRVIPTTVDTSYHKPMKVERDDRICIGWTGSPTTVPHFELAVPALKEIKERYGDRVRFKVIGEASYENKALGIKGQAWNKDTEIQDLSDIDIGIMPLPDTEWAKGKCGLKALQYMAMKIPPVISPVGVNKEIVEHGVNGFLAGTKGEWVEYLDRSVREASLREKLAASARETVQNRYSVDANKSLYAEALEEVMVAREH